MEILVLFLIGLTIGSFINVCVWRIPKKLSIISPGSHCPNCMHPIHWYDNIPLVSYILLKGKCRYCQNKISVRYPIIELVTGILFLVLYYKFGLQKDLFFAVLLTVLLIIVSGIDWEHKIIPDVITYPAMITGVLVSFFNPLLPAVNLGITHFPILNPVLYSIISLVVSGGILYLISLAGDWIFRKESMGGGDIKLIAVIGSFMGIPNVLLTILIASFLGTIIGVSAILLKYKKPSDQIPFGPYLSVGAFLTLIFQPQLTNFYMNLFR